MKVEAIISKVLADQHEQPRTSDSGSPIRALAVLVGPVHLEPARRSGKL